MNEKECKYFVNIFLAINLRYGAFLSAMNCSASSLFRSELPQEPLRLAQYVAGFFLFY